MSLINQQAAFRNCYIYKKIITQTYVTWSFICMCVLCDDIVSNLSNVLPCNYTKYLKSAMHLTTQIAQQTGPANEQDHLVTDRNN